MRAAGTLESKWSPSSKSPVGGVLSSSSSFSSSSLPPGVMDDLPFCLEDLPPEIRNKIDDIIENNEDLETQLDAIDALLFANRPQVKSDVNNKFDLGNESGIGSDSDSGHGIVPAPDLLSNSPFPSKPLEELLKNDAKTFGPPPPRTSALDDDVDDFISRLIVPPPPYLTSPASSPARLGSPSKGSTFTSSLTFFSGLNSSAANHGSASTPPKTRKSDLFDGDLPVYIPPPPLGFEESPQKQVPEPKSPRPVEAITAVKTGQNFLVTVDIPRDALTKGSPVANTNNSNATRVHVGKVGEQLPVNVTSVPVVSKPLRRQVSDASDSSTAKRSQLYAWNKTPELSSIREDPPHKPTDASLKKSLTLPVTAPPERPSELNLSSKDKQPRFWKKGKEKYASTDLITTPTRYSPQVATGPTVDLRRKKWRPSSDVLPEGGKSISMDSDRRQVSRSAGNSDVDVGDEDKKSDDDLSGLVVMRVKNGKPAQSPRIDSKTPKAQSMLSLYDPASDPSRRSKNNKSDKTKAKEKTKSYEPFAFLRGGKNKKHHPDVREKLSCERSESLDVSASRMSDLEPLRSDYLFPVPPPLSVRSSIPSPSLYASVNLRSSNSLQLRSPPPPGDISDILRIDVRDLDAGNTRRPVTFGTFRGEIQPIRWSEEKTRFPVSNRWSHEAFEKTDSLGDNGLRTSSALVSKCSLPVNLLQVVKSGGDRPKSVTRQDAVEEAQQPNRPSPPKATPRVHLEVARMESARQRSPCILIVDGDSTPLIKVTPAKVVTPTQVMTPAAEPPQVFIPSPTAAGKRLSVASACFSTPIPEEFMDGGNHEPRPGRSVTPVLLSPPNNEQLTKSLSNPRLDVAKTVPGRLSPRPTLAGSADQQEPNSRISPCPSLTSVVALVSGSDKDDIDSLSWHGLEELHVLQTTYENDVAGGRAEDDIRRMLSSLDAQRNWLLSAGTTSSSNSSDIFRLRKESLATQSRRLVTEAKLMVSAATRSRLELTSTLTPVVHTVARVFDSCRLVLEVLPPGVRRTMPLDQVLEVGRMFLDTLSSANLAAGRKHDDPAMVQLMTRTTALAQALYKLVNTTKSLNNRA